MELSIVMPVYNEKNSIIKMIDKLLSIADVDELVIVDDGSSDGTVQILKNAKFDERVKCFFQDKNRGKGSAIREGFKHITKDIVAIQDADLEYDPQDLNTLIKPIKDGVADVVYGSRLSGGRPQRVYMFWHWVGNKFLTLVTNFLFNSTLSDMETGYKAFRNDVIKSIKLRSNRFEIEPEITAKVLKKKLRVYEVPISYYGRTYAEGKKITWRDGLKALVTLIRYRFMD